MAWSVIGQTVTVVRDDKKKNEKMKTEYQEKLLRTKSLSFK